MITYNNYSINTQKIYSAYYSDFLPDRLSLPLSVLNKLDNHSSVYHIVK